jgi:hypothetical protein
MRLRRQGERLLAGYKPLDPRLSRIARTLKIAGPAMLAFDAATTYAKASDQWQNGAKDDAAETLAAFGGRVGGAFIGAESLGLMLGGFGSVVPGLGTTVGALVGGLIGGAVGAYVGEEKTKELCRQIIEWAHGRADASGPRLADQYGENIGQLSPVGDGSRDFTQASVVQLQREMSRCGYSAPEANFVCELVSGRIVGEAARDPDAPWQVLRQLGESCIPADLHEPDQPFAAVDEYPWPAVTQDGYASPSSTEPEVSGDTPDFGVEQLGAENSDAQSHLEPDHEEVVHGAVLGQSAGPESPGASGGTTTEGTDPTAPPIVAEHFGVSNDDAGPAEPSVGDTAAPDHEEVAHGAVLGDGDDPGALVNEVEPVEDEESVKDEEQADDDEEQADDDEEEQADDEDDDQQSDDDWDDYSTNDPEDDDDAGSDYDSDDEE